MSAAGSRILECDDGETPTTLDRLLESGGGIEVWRGLDAVLRREVLVKRATDDAASALVIAEARALGQLDHPGIISVHEAGRQKDGHAYFIMPALDGRSLEDVLQEAEHSQGSWPPSRLVGILARVSDALEHAHQQGFVHGSLAAHGVLVGGHGEVVITSWGMGRKGSVSEDCAALGALLERIAGLWPSRPSPELSAIIRQAVTHANGASAAMQDLRQDLLAFLEGRVVRAYATGAWPELRKWVARNRALTTALTGVVALLLATPLSVNALAARHRSRLERSQREIAAADTALRADERRSRSASDEILSLADHRRLEALLRRSDELWPTRAAIAPDLAAWLTEARALAVHLESHRARLAVVERRLAAMDAAADPIARRREQWLADRLVALVHDLEAFQHPASGAIVGVERRLAYADLLDGLTVAGPAAVRAWSGAIASIANPMECPLYRGLLIVPQRGLLPLGRDPMSGLWEFLHAETTATAAAVARAGARSPDAERRFDPELGLILVLLPGGEFAMGSQSEARSLPNYDPYAWPNEQPVQTVSLDPFFLSKYELTNAQWERITRQSSSEPKLPKSQVSWTEAARWLPRLGLELPTEAQWEHAARAGTDTTWSTGNDVRSLQGCANLHPAITNDGYDAWSPVDRLCANGFGLFGTLGNVSEWCRDDYGSAWLACAPGDGLRASGGDLRKVVRGAHHASNEPDARSAFRAARSPEYRHITIGIRPARALEQ